MSSRRLSFVGFLSLVAVTMLVLAARTVSADCVPGNHVDKPAFFTEVARQLRNPSVPDEAMDFAVRAFLAWEPYENTLACWNPLATTLRYSGECRSSTLPGNTAGVQEYPSRECGIRATAETINYTFNGNGQAYQAIRRMMARQSFDEAALIQELRRWVGSEGYARAVVSQWRELYYGSSGGSGPSGYTFCAWEDERCSFSGTADVAYGANGQFAYRQNISGGIDCNNGVFGDPIFGTRKACYFRPVASGQPDYTPPAGYAFCAWEDERCNFGGTADVAYGANGRFAYRQNISGGIDCNNGVFGDPARGTRKACYLRPRGDRGCTPNADQVALFVDTAYGGGCVLKGSGNYPHPSAIGLPNDSISSLQVGGNVQAILCEHDDYQGACETFTGNDGDLNDNRIGNDRVSSLRVERRGVASGPSDCPGQYRAEYFANRDLSGSPVLVRCEGWPIRHDWSGGSPGSGVPDDGFSARWTGRARIDSGTYTFIARADDGIRVRLGGDLIIDAWRDQSPTEYKVARQVSVGEYEVQVEYYENGGGALVEFRWERASASTSCTGAAIGLEQRVEGRLSDAAPSVSYCLHASAGQMISTRMFALGNDDLDTYLKMWSPDGQLLAENDDGLNIGYNSFLSVRLPRDGIYRIEATRYSGQGRYALRVEAGFEAAVGDLDRDCDVDNVDRNRLRSLLGRADPNADLDLDGMVSSRDAIFQMRSLGVRCQ